MKIGFDISQTGAGKAGCGYYAHALFEALLKTDADCSYLAYPSFGDFYFDPKMPVISPYSGKQVSYGPRHLTRELAGAFWNQEKLEDKIGAPDIVHSNNFWTPINLKSSKLVYTLYDLGFTHTPDWTTEANRLGCFEGVFKASMYADWIVAISESSKNDFLSTFPHFPEDRIEVIYPCSRFLNPSQIGVKPKLDKLLPQKYWLSVGTIEPRKNQKMLVEAYADYIAQGGDPIPLVLAGGSGWLMETFPDLISDLNLDDLVILTGYISDDELIWLYRNCYANLYPSFFEGFGLPILEGMQFGAATLSSNSTSLPEVLGDAGAALSPNDKSAWVDCMLSLASNVEERKTLSKKAAEHAATFSWESSANALMSVYQKALSYPKREALL